MSEKRILVRFFGAASITALFAIAANFLKRHSNGENVDDPLTQICDELAKREGIDFAGCNITKVETPNVSSVAANDNGVAEMVIGGVFISTVVLGLFLLFSRARQAYAL